MKRFSNRSVYNLLDLQYLFRVQSYFSGTVCITLKSQNGVLTKSQDTGNLAYSNFCLAAKRVCVWRVLGACYFSDMDLSAMAPNVSMGHAIETSVDTSCTEAFNVYEEVGGV